MPTPEQPIYVVISQNDKPFGRDGKGDPDGPIVFEVYVKEATLEKARARASEFERRFGACRVGRVVFDDESGGPL